MKLVLIPYPNDPGRGVWVNPDHVAGVERDDVFANGVTTMYSKIHLVGGSVFRVKHSALAVLEMLKEPSHE